MIGRFLVPLTVIVLAVGGLGAKDDKKGDKDKLQGEWALVTLEAPGGKGDEAFIKKSKLVVKGEDWLITFKGKDVKFTVKLDPAKSPKEIDFTQGGARPFKTLGIYKLDGDTLTVSKATFRAADPSGRGERPKELKPGDDVFFYVYKGADADAEELAKLQGDWAIVSREVNGAKAPGKPPEIVLTIKDDQWVETGVSFKDKKGTFKIDASKTPKTIDKTSRGQGDTLSVCVTNGTERPKEFKTTDKDKEQVILTVWKCAKK